MTDDLEYIERANKADIAPEFVIIWLHGLGADCEDFLPVVSQLKLNFSVKFIFPNAKLRPIAFNNGYLVRAWYNIYNLDIYNHKIDEDGIKESVSQIYKIIEKQIKGGVSPNKIILAGFSQGGVISYYAGLSNEYKLGGILALSCYLPEFELLNNLNKSISIFACHGINDAVIPYKAGFIAYEYLHKKGCNITWHEYLMEHTLCDLQITDIANWLNSLGSK
ncbi:MAG TPA: carboxylesterase [Burkholderiales bacterium]|nr:carboxylesterase [Burkholderiales bacterium]